MNLLIMLLTILTLDAYLLSAIHIEFYSNSTSYDVPFKAFNTKQKEWGDFVYIKMTREFVNFQCLIDFILTY